MSSAAVSYARDNQRPFPERTERLPKHPRACQHPDEDHKGDIRRPPRWCADELKRIGFENVEIIPRPRGIRWSMPTGCTPPASRRRSAMRTTMSSPPSRSTSGSRLRSWTRMLSVKGDEAQAAKQNWEQPPVRNDNIYARGASDDKGQLCDADQSRRERSSKPTASCPVNVECCWRAKRKWAASISKRMSRRMPSRRG